MKFRKHLSSLIEGTFPSWQDKFLSYKDLKKEVKRICLKDENIERGNKRRKLDDDGVVENEVDSFVEMLHKEIDKFNGFFLDQQEEYVIKSKVLKERVAEMKESSPFELFEVGRQIVDFHGEMILLENYSALNYTGLLKILKKYDKRTGALIRMPFIQTVLHQPFFKTDVLKDLVKECETMVKHLFPCMPIIAPSQDKDDSGTVGVGKSEERIPQRVPEELSDIQNMENMYLRHTLSALHVLKEIRSRSSTVNELSLPPIQSKEIDESWRQAPIVEQAAK
ncbi:hypothetical protein Leryth_010904 [Lithospermum erythrorhizon]|nr:hypothetical protein Leryth_010904 [Lithospermum erythrorhizon]